MTRKRRNIPRDDKPSELAVLVAQAVRSIGPVGIGALVSAPDVAVNSIVRDGDGTYYFVRHVYAGPTRDPWRMGQVVRGAALHRVGDLKPFHWFTRGVFEVVALDVPEEATTEAIGGLIACFEQAHGEARFLDGTTIPAQAVDVSSHPTEREGGRALDADPTEKEPERDVVELSDRKPPVGG